MFPNIVLSLLFSLTAHAAKKPKDCRALFVPTFVVRVEFDRDVRARVHAWHRSIEAHQLDLADFAMDSRGEIASFQIAGRVEDVSRWAHSLGAISIFVTPSTEPADVAAWAQSREELGWNGQTEIERARNLSIRDVGLTLDTIFGLVTAFNVRTLQDLTWVSHSELVSSRIFTAKQIVGIVALMESHSLRLREGEPGVFSRADHLLDVALEEVGFDLATLRRLDRKGGVTSLRDIVALTEHELSRTPGFGDLAVSSVKARLHALGFEFGTDPDSLPSTAILSRSQLNQPLSSLALPKKFEGPLTRAGVSTIRDLIQFRAYELRLLGKWSESSLEPIKTALSQRKLRLRHKFYGAEAMDPSRVAALRRQGPILSDGTIDPEPYLKTRFSDLPLPAVLRLRLAWLGVETLQDLRKLPEHKLRATNLSDARLSNLDAFLNMFGLYFR